MTGFPRTVFLPIALGALCSIFLLGCFPSNDTAAGKNEDYVLQRGEPAYGLAQGCYAIQSYRYDRYVSRQVFSDRAGLHTDDIDSAETFFLKPSALGEFILYSQDQKGLDHSTGVPRLFTQITRQSIWRIYRSSLHADAEDESHLGDEVYELLKPDAARSVDPQIALSALYAQDEQLHLESSITSSSAGEAAEPLPDSAKAFVFERLEDSRCQAYPEAALDARLVADAQDVSPVEGDTAAPIVGFADLHTHIAFPKTMASVAMSGDIFHPLGIKQALGNCSLIHGKQGRNDFLEGQNTGSSDGHETSGYPEFGYWPNRETNTHVQAYYRWIERAHLSGLKLLVSHVTGNPSFCQLLKTMHASRARGACTGLDAVEQQTEYLYQLQDYVDAQAGGPGKGWFRIVLTPQQARKVIAQGQMAVVLGVEHGELFDCRSSNEACTSDYIETQLDHLHELGIRSVFPLHRFDNAFGGTKPGGGDSGAWMHFSSRISTSSINHIIADILNPFAFRNGIDGEFYDLQDCPEPARGTDNIRDMDAFMHEGFSSVKDAVPFGLGRYLDPLLIDKLEPIPRYEAFTLENKPACNARGLQTLGVDLLNGLIDRAMIVEVDHLSYQTFSDVLDVLEQRGYPGFISSHSWFENQAEVRDRIHRLGGMISPMKSTPSSSAHAITTLSAERERFGLPSGVAISTDIQGVTSQAAADEGFVLQYPMRSYDGKVEFLAPKTGLRSFDYSVEGVAHYGLLPEWVDNLRQVDEHDNKVMSAFMASAEAYIQLWESAAAY